MLKSVLGKIPILSKKSKEVDIHKAARKGNLKKLRKAKPSKINSLDEENRTALHFACAKGLAECIDYLVTARDADPNIPDIDGNTPAHKLILEGHSRHLSILLAGDQVKLDLPNKSGYTLLHAACIKGDLTVVQVLLSCDGVCLDAINQDGQTPLHVASREGCPQVVQALLEAGANPDVKDKVGRTCLMYACIDGQTKVVKILCNRGADITVKDAFNQDAMNYAQKHHECFLVVEEQHKKLEIEVGELSVIAGTFPRNFQWNKNKASIPDEKPAIGIANAGNNQSCTRLTEYVKFQEDHQKNEMETEAENSESASPLPAEARAVPSSKPQSSGASMPDEKPATGFINTGTTCNSTTITEADPDTLNDSWAPSDTEEEEEVKKKPSLLAEGMRLMRTKEGESSNILEVDSSTIVPLGNTNRPKLDSIMSVPVTQISFAEKQPIINVKEGLDHKLSALERTTQSSHKIVKTTVINDTTSYPDCFSFRDCRTDESDKLLDSLKESDCFSRIQGSVSEETMDKLSKKGGSTFSKVGKAVQPKSFHSYLGDTQKANDRDTEDCNPINKLTLATNDKGSAHSGERMTTPVHQYESASGSSHSPEDSTPRWHTYPSVHPYTIQPRPGQPKPSTLYECTMQPHEHMYTSGTAVSSQGRSFQHIYTSGAQEVSQGSVQHQCSPVGSQGNVQHQGSPVGLQRSVATQGTLASPRGSVLTQGMSVGPQKSAQTQGSPMGPWESKITSVSRVTYPIPPDESVFMPPVSSAQQSPRMRSQGLHSMISQENPIVPSGQGSALPLKDYKYEGMDILAKKDGSKFSKEGHSALHLASYGGYQEVVHVLLEGGANPDVQDPEGRCVTALEEHQKKLEREAENAASASPLPPEPGAVQSSNPQSRKASMIDGKPAVGFTNMGNNHSYTPITEADPDTLNDSWAPSDMEEEIPKRPSLLAEGMNIMTTKEREQSKTVKIDSSATVPMTNTNRAHLDSIMSAPVTQISVSGGQPTNTREGLEYAPSVPKTHTKSSIKTTQAAALNNNSGYPDWFSFQDYGTDESENHSNLSDLLRESNHPPSQLAKETKESSAKKFVDEAARNKEKIVRYANSQPTQAVPTTSPRKSHNSITSASPSKIPAEKNSVTTALPLGEEQHVTDNSPHYSQHSAGSRSNLPPYLSSATESKPLIYKQISSPPVEPSFVQGPAASTQTSPRISQENPSMKGMTTPVHQYESSFGSSHSPEDSTPRQHTYPSVHPYTIQPVPGQPEPSTLYECTMQPHEHMYTSGTAVSSQGRSFQHIYTSGAQEVSQGSVQHKGSPVGLQRSVANQGTLVSPQGSVLTQGMSVGPQNSAQTQGSPMGPWESKMTSVSRVTYPIPPDESVFMPPVSSAQQSPRMLSQGLHSMISQENPIEPSGQGSTLPLKDYKLEGMDILAKKDGSTFSKVVKASNRNETSSMAELPLQSTMLSQTGCVQPKSFHSYLGDIQKANDRDTEDCNPINKLTSATINNECAHSGDLLYSTSQPTHSSGAFISTSYTGPSYTGTGNHTNKVSTSATYPIHSYLTSTALPSSSGTFTHSVGSPIYTGSPINTTYNKASVQEVLTKSPVYTYKSPLTTTSQTDMAAQNSNSMSKSPTFTIPENSSYTTKLDIDSGLHKSYSFNSSSCNEDSPTLPDVKSSLIKSPRHKSGSCSAIPTRTFVTNISIQNRGRHKGKSSEDEYNLSFDSSGKIVSSTPRSSTSSGSNSPSVSPRPSSTSESHNHHSRKRSSEYHEYKPGCKLHGSSPGKTKHVTLTDSKDRKTNSSEKTHSSRHKRTLSCEQSPKEHQRRISKDDGAKTSNKNSKSSSYPVHGKVSASDEITPTIAKEQGRQQESPRPNRLAGYSEQQEHIADHSINEGNDFLESGEAIINTTKHHQTYPSNSEELDPPIAGISFYSVSTTQGRRMSSVTSDKDSRKERKSRESSREKQNRKKMSIESEASISRKQVTDKLDGGDVASEEKKTKHRSRRSRSVERRSRSRESNRSTSGSNKSMNQSRDKNGERIRDRSKKSKERSESMEASEIEDLHENTKEHNVRSQSGSRRTNNSRSPAGSHEEKGHRRSRSGNQVLMVDTKFSLVDNDANGVSSISESYLHSYYGQSTLVRTSISSSNPRSSTSSRSNSPSLSPRPTSTSESHNHHSWKRSSEYQEYKPGCKLHGSSPGKTNHVTLTDSKEGKTNSSEKTHSSRHKKTGSCEQSPKEYRRRTSKDDGAKTSNNSKSSSYPVHGKVSASDEITPTVAKEQGRQQESPRPNRLAGYSEQQEPIAGHSINEGNDFLESGEAIINTTKHHQTYPSNSEKLDPPTAGISFYSVSTTQGRRMSSVTSDKDSRKERKSRESSKEKQNRKKMSIESEASTSRKQVTDKLDGGDVASEEKKTKHRSRRSRSVERRSRSRESNRSTSGSNKSMNQSRDKNGERIRDRSKLSKERSESMEASEIEDLHENTKESNVRSQSGSRRTNNSRSPAGSHEEKGHRRSRSGNQILMVDTKFSSVDNDANGVSSISESYLHSSYGLSSSLQTSISSSNPQSSTSSRSNSPCLSPRPTSTSESHNHHSRKRLSEYHEYKPGCKIHGSSPGKTKHVTLTDSKEGKTNSSEKTHSSRHKRTGSCEQSPKEHRRRTSKDDGAKTLNKNSKSSSYPVHGKVSASDEITPTVAKEQGRQQESPRPNRLAGYSEQQEPIAGHSINEGKDFLESGEFIINTTKHHQTYSSNSEELDPPIAGISFYSVSTTQGRRMSSVTSDKDSRKEKKSRESSREKQNRKKMSIESEASTSRIQVTDKLDGGDMASEEKKTKHRSRRSRSVERRSRSRESNTTLETCLVHEERSNEFPCQYEELCATKSRLEQRVLPAELDLRELKYHIQKRDETIKEQNTMHRYLMDFIKEKRLDEEVESRKSAVLKAREYELEERAKTISQLKKELQVETDARQLHEELYHKQVRVFQALQIESTRRQVYQADLEKKLHEANGAKMELETHLASATSDLSLLKEEIAAIKRRGSLTESAYEDELVNLKEQLKALEDKNTEIIQNRVDIKTTFQHNLEELHRKAQFLNDCLDTEKERRALLEKENASLKADRDELFAQHQEAISLANKRERNFSQKLGEKIREGSANDCELRKTRELLSTQKVRLESTEAQVVMMEIATRSSQQESSQRANKVACLEQTCQKLQDNVCRLEEYSMGLEKRSKEMEANLESVSRQLRQARQRETIKCQVYQADLEMKLHEANGAKMELETHLASATSDLSVLKEEIVAIKHRGLLTESAYEDELVNLKEQLKALGDKNTEIVQNRVDMKTTFQHNLEELHRKAQFLNDCLDTEKERRALLEKENASVKADRDELFAQHQETISLAKERECSLCQQLEEKIREGSIKDCELKNTREHLSTQKARLEFIEAQMVMMEKALKTSEQESSQRAHKAASLEQTCQQLQDNVCRLEEYSRGLEKRSKEMDAKFESVSNRADTLEVEKERLLQQLL